MDDRGRRPARSRRALGRCVARDRRNGPRPQRSSTASTPPAPGSSRASRGRLEGSGRGGRIVGARPEHATLLREAAFAPRRAGPRAARGAVSLLADMGESVYLAGRDLDRRPRFSRPHRRRRAEGGAAAAPLAADLDRLSSGADGPARRAADPDDQFLRRRHRRAAGHRAARPLRRAEPHRRSRRHPHLARARRDADLDHGRRPLGLGDHGRARRHEHARGARRAARHGARSDGGAGAAAAHRAGRRSAAADLSRRHRGADRRHARRLGLRRGQPARVLGASCNIPPA